MSYAVIIIAEKPISSIINIEIIKNDYEYSWGQLKKGSPLNMLTVGSV